MPSTEVGDARGEVVVLLSAALVSEEVKLEDWLFVRLRHSLNWE